MQDGDNDVAPNDGLDEALANRPEPEPHPGDAAAEKQDEAGQPRDEQGRFAPNAQAEEEADETEDEGEERDGGRVPSWRLREERERAEAAERRAAEHERELAGFRQWLAQQQRQQEVQQEPEPPDPISDPQGFAAYFYEMRRRDREEAIAYAREIATDDRVNWTFAQSHKEYKAEFDQAMTALEQVGDPRLVQEIRQSVNPGETLMRWYDQTSPERLEKRIREKLKKDADFRKEFMAELDAEARGSNGNERSLQHNVTSLPSVNRAAGRAERQTPGSLGSTDAEKFANLSAMDGRR